MERSKRKGLREWERIVGEQEKSGLNAAEFCRRSSIGLAGFYKWRKRIGDSRSRQVSMVDSAETFVDMGRIGIAGVPATPGSSPWIVSLDFGDDIKLTLRRG
jgi:hypothetical protein